jgi:hypothetical protein
LDLGYRLDISSVISVIFRDNEIKTLSHIYNENESKMRIIDTTSRCASYVCGNCKNPDCTSGLPRMYYREIINIIISKATLPRNDEIKPLKAETKDFNAWARRAWQKDEICKLGICRAAQKELTSPCANESSRRNVAAH